MRLPMIFRLSYLVGQRFWQRNGLDSVSILAYTTLVGLVPALAVMVSLFSVSEYFSEFRQLIMHQLVDILAPSSQELLSTYLNRFADQAVKLQGPGLVIMLGTTLMLLATIDQKINQIWQNKRPRSWVKSLLHYLGVALFGPILLGASLMVSSTLAAMPLVDDRWDFMGVRHQFLSLLPFFTAWLGFTLVYKWVPSHKILWRASIWGGFLAAAQMELLKWGFRLYIEAFPTYNLIYGALAIVPILLLWLYLLWLVLIGNGFVVYFLNRLYRLSAH